MKKVTTGKILFCLPVASCPGGTTLTRPTVIFFPSRCGLRLFSQIFPFVNSKFQISIPNLVWRKQIANRKSAIENFPLALLSDV